MINEGAINRFLDDGDFDPRSYETAESLADDLVFKLLGHRLADYGDLRQQKGLGKLFADTARDAAGSILQGAEAAGLLKQASGDIRRGSITPETRHSLEAIEVKAAKTETLIYQLERVARTYSEQN